MSELQSLLANIRACRICRENPSGPALPHDPRPVVVASPRARILIAGQAPGTKVHATGLPFNDASGDRLRQWLGVGREEFYDPARFAIIPMGFCFPGQDPRGSDLPPRRECAPAWRAALISHLPHVDLVLAIGLHALRWHLPSVRGESLSGILARWREIVEQSHGPRIFPLPHPSWRNTAWLKKNPWFEMELLPVLREEIRHRL